MITKFNSNINGKLVRKSDSLIKKVSVHQYLLNREFNDFQKRVKLEYWQRKINLISQSPGFKRKCEALSAKYKFLKQSNLLKNNILKQVAPFSKMKDELGVTLNLQDRFPISYKNCIFKRGCIPLKPRVFAGSVFNDNGFENEELPEIFNEIINDVESDVDSDVDSDIESISLSEKENKKQKKKEEEVLQLELSIDSEYVVNEGDVINPSVPLSVQAIFRYKNKEIIKFFIINEIFKSQINVNKIEQVCKNANINLYYKSFLDEREPLVLSCFYEYLNNNNSLINLENVKQVFIDTFIYYTPKDLTYAFGYSNLLPYYNGKIKTLKTQRNIKGKFKINYNNINHTMKIKDLSGYNKGGLKVLAESVGLKKLDVLDNYKANMDLALKEKPEEFILYGMNDADLLLNIYDLKINTFNEIYGILSITDSSVLFNKINTPTTIGSVVYTIFKNFLKFKVFKTECVLLACLKQGILNKMHKNYNNNYDSFEKLNKFRNLQELINFESASKKEFRSMLSNLSSYKAFIYSIWQYCSVDYLVSESAQDTNVAILGLTTGGRTNNERHKEAEIEFGADVDLSGAYGNCLRKQLFPIGRPRVFNTTSNEVKKMTLGKFMNKYGSQLSSGLYKITVSGPLDFEQDLIFSKACLKDFKNYKKVYDKEDADSEIVTAPLVLLRKEIENGFITPRIWEVIKQVANKNEMNKINNLKVLSAIYYLDSDRVNTIEELADKFLQDKGEYKFDQQLNSINDTRTYSWYGAPLSILLDPLIEKRSLLKKQKDSISFAIQDSIKLLINSLWGVITSPFFSVNNVIVSEIVTASIRTDVWLVSKSLNTFMSITDGGPYSLMNVTFFKKNLNKLKKPGLHALSSYYNYKNHPSLTFGSLNGVDWKAFFLNNIPPTDKEFQNLDLYAQVHVENFWSEYGISLNSKLEHKILNCFRKASYFSKAHYMLLTFDENLKTYSQYYYKLRGFRFDSNIQYQNPLYDFMKHIIDFGLDNQFHIPNNGIYYQKNLLRIPSWRNSLIDQFKRVSSYGPGIQPGDAILKESRFVLNNIHFPIGDVSIFKKRYLRTTKYTNMLDNNNNVAKVKMLLYERYLFRGATIKEVLEKMELDNLHIK